MRKDSPNLPLLLRKNGSDLAHPEQPKGTHMTPRQLSMILPFLGLAACMDAAGYGVGPTNGGSVVEVRREIGAHIFTDEVFCLSEPVYSAHTMFVMLGPDRIKTTPGNVWGFHGAENAITARWAERGTHALAATYPDRLKAWFWDGPAYLHGDDFEIRSGAWMIENGFAGEC
jgi:hypothetical protein